MSGPARTRQIARKYRRQENRKRRYSLTLNRGSNRGAGKTLFIVSSCAFHLELIYVPELRWEENAHARTHRVRVVAELPGFRRRCAAAEGLHIPGVAAQHRW